LNIQISKRAAKNIRWCRDTERGIIFNTDGYAYAASDYFVKIFKHGLELYEDVWMPNGIVQVVSCEGKFDGSLYTTKGFTFENKESSLSFEMRHIPKRVEDMSFSIDATGRYDLWENSNYYFVISNNEVRINGYKVSDTEYNFNSINLDLRDIFRYTKAFKVVGDGNKFWIDYDDRTVILLRR